MVAGRYRIAGMLGFGGMGEVYRADDTKLDQPVALKFLPARLARDPLLLERLHDEVRLGRQIAHPNVCRIYDIVDWEGAPFVAMEYVDGEDLSRLLKRIGRIAHDKAVDIARGLAAGLMGAHAKGILHRDLKPANVMIDSRGDSRIMDFGVHATAMRQSVDSGTVPPEVLARLGWWYFRAHRVAEARAVLERAVAVRPDDLEVRNNLAWVVLEEGKDAKSRFESMTLAEDTILGNTADPGKVINAWQQKKLEAALSDWKSIRQSIPQWRSAPWRDAIYPPRIAGSVAQMEAELARREQVRSEMAQREFKRRRGKTTSK